MTDTIEVLAQQIEALRRGMFKESVNPQLAYSAIDDGYLSLVSNGQLSGLVGTIFDGTTGAFSVAGPNPPQPAAPALMQCIGGITVIWSGLWVDPQPGFTSPVVAPMDFSYVEVAVSDHSDFSLNVVTKQIVSARGGSVDFAWTRINTPLYARLRAVSAAGKSSSYSATTGPLASGGMDVTIPQAPTGLALTTLATFSSTGDHMASITATWTGVASNTDGSAFDDFSHYDVQWWWTSLPSAAAQMVSATTTTATWTVGPGLAYNVQVRAVDITGHVSAWTSISSITAAVDTTAPNAPSAPVVSSYLGQLRIFWDGKDSLGAAMPIDFSVVEVHVSATSGFTPSSATLVSQISNAVYAYATAPYGATRYVKFIAVDSSLNRSLPSAQSSGATTQVADGDISSLSIGKLTAGTISVDVVVGGRFTTALTGARVEMNSLGFQKFDVDGVSKLVSITGTEALLTGIYKTATGGRRIEIGSGGSLGEMDFFAPDGTQALLRAFTESAGVESMQFGVPIIANAGQTYDFLWNRWHANSDEWAEIRSNKVDVTVGSHRAATGAQGYFIVRSSPDRGQTAAQRMYIDNTTWQVYNSAGNAPQLYVDDTQFIYQQINSFYRFRVTATAMNYWDQGGQVRWAMDTGLAYWDPQGRNRMYINDTQIGFYNTQAQKFFIDFAPAGNLTVLPGLVAGDSARLQFINAAGYAAMWKMYYAVGDSGGLRFEARDANDAGFVQVNAAAFNVVSDRSAKADISDFDGTALDALRGVRLRRYRLTPATATESGEPVEQPLHLGLVTDEAPPAVVGGEPGHETVSVYALAALAAAAAPELAEQLRALTERIVVLEEGASR